MSLERRRRRRRRIGRRRRLHLKYYIPLYTDITSSHRHASDGGGGGSFFQEASWRYNSSQSSSSKIITIIVLSSSKAMSSSTSASSKSRYSREGGGGGKGRRGGGVVVVVVETRPEHPDVGARRDARVHLVHRTRLSKARWNGFEKLSDEVEPTKAIDTAKANDKTKDDAMSLTLYKRIEDIKKIDDDAVEDAMYASVIHKVITTKTYEQSYLFLRTRNASLLFCVIQPADNATQIHHHHHHHTNVSVPLLFLRTVLTAGGTCSRPDDDAFKSRFEQVDVGYLERGVGDGQRPFDGGVGPGGELVAESDGENEQTQAAQVHGIDYVWVFREESTNGFSWIERLGRCRRIRWILRLRWKTCSTRPRRWIPWTKPRMIHNYAGDEFFGGFSEKKRRRFKQPKSKGGYSRNWQADVEAIRKRSLGNSG